LSNSVADQIIKADLVVLLSLLLTVRLRLYVAAVQH